MVDERIVSSEKEVNNITALGKIKTRKKYIQQSFLHRTIAQWNRHPEEVAIAPTLDAFKSAVCALNH